MKIRLRPPAKAALNALNALDLNQWDVIIKPDEFGLKIYVRPLKNGMRPESSALDAVLDVWRWEMAPDMPNAYILQISLNTSAGSWWSYAGEIIDDERGGE